jgi:hypothetical protein
MEWSLHSKGMLHDSDEIRCCHCGDLIDKTEKADYAICPLDELKTCVRCRKEWIDGHQCTSSKLLTKFSPRLATEPTGGRDPICLIDAQNNKHSSPYSPYDTIESLIRKIKERLKIEIQMFRLCLEGAQEISPGCSLRENRIFAGTKIFLRLRTRGG